MSNTPIQWRFGHAVKTCREDAGWSQEQLAHASGLSRSYVGDIERGARNIALGNIEKILDSLGIQIWEFFKKYEVQQ